MPQRTITVQGLRQELSSAGGTANTIAKFTGPSTLGNSSVTDDGSTVAVTGILTVSGAATITGLLTASNALTVTTGTLTMGTSQAIDATTTLIHQIGGTTIFTTSANGIKLGTSLAIDGTTSVVHKLAGATIFTTSANGIILGTSLAIDGTTSVLQKVDGTTVGTWSAGGLALARTSGDLTLSAITTTSGRIFLENRGYNSDTTPTTANGGGVNVYLRNLDTTANNYNRIINKDAGDQETSGIAFINESDANNTGSIAFMTRPSGGSLTRVVNITSTGRINAVDGAVGTPTYSFINATGLGRYAAGTGEMTDAVAGVAEVSYRAGIVALRSAVSFGWASGDPTSVAQDVILVRDAANVLALKNGTTAQEARIYFTTTGPDYVGLKAAASALLLGSGAGTFDNVEDLGATASRVRTGYFGTRVYSADFYAGATVAASGQLNATTTAYGVGTAYVLTNSAAAIDFGTTDPSITLPVVGTYLIMAQVNLAYNAATVVAETATIKVRRTNNTAADLSVIPVLDLPVATTLTHTYGIFQIPPFVYTTTTTTDIVTIFANVSAALGAGSIDATAIGTSIVAMRIS